LKFIPLLLLLLLSSEFLNASYLRTIRVGSFLNEPDAQEALSELENYVYNDEELHELQKKWGFELKERKSGQYYITLIEPFTKREVLQKVLDKLRLEYKDVYVTKLKKLPQNFEKNNIKEKVSSSPVMAMKENAVFKEIKETTIPIEKVQLKQEVVKPELVQKQEEQKRLETISDEKQALNIWQILFFGAFTAFLILLWFFVKNKKENETLSNNDLIYTERIKQATLNIESKEKFLSHASHELRTPMTAIMGLTHLVLENELPKFQREYIEKIQISAEHLVNIINDILDISKIQAGKLRIEKEEFNLNDILDYVLNIISIQAKNNNVIVAVEIDQDVPSRIIGDSLRLGQVLINLLGNAVKFTYDGEVTLYVKKVDIFANNIDLEFTIEDSGIGMTQEQVQKVFHSFSQADESTSRKFGGTGLGLSISKQLVEMMDGDIKVQSQKDVGTSFTFTIPFKLKDTEDKRQYRLPSSKLLNKRVLIIDSTDKESNSLVHGFSYFNYVSHAIPSFEEAVFDPEMLFDIVVIHQNDLSKFAVKKIQELKKHSKGKCKVVLLNELNSSFNINMLHGLKVDAYFKTPFTQQSVLNLIIELFEMKKLESSLKIKTLKEQLSECKDKKILVAEDNILNHKVIAGLLSKTGIELTFVMDGQEVVDLVNKGIETDLILMDINMPKINGYDAAKEIRKNKKYDAIPILALTADVMDEAIDKAFEAGMQGHIAKPIIVDIFYKKILDVLSVKRSQVKPNIHILTATHDNKEEYEELSVSIGLSRCNDDIDFYKSILKDFKVMYLNSAVALEDLCREGHFKEARRKSMDIKDVALNIGAYKLCESAAAMEYEFEKGSRSNWHELIFFYAKSLEKLFSEIDHYLKVN